MPVLWSSEGVLLCKGFIGALQGSLLESAGYSCGAVLIGLGLWGISSVL